MDRTDFPRTKLPAIDDYCVVLERLAVAAGQTRWYVAEVDDALMEILAEIVPGSAVSLYFDGRLRRSTWSAETASGVLAVVSNSGECVVAVASPSGHNLLPYFISGANDLAEFVGEIPDGAVVYFGPYPMRDNDGVRAVSFVVPDAQGRIDLPH